MGSSWVAMGVVKMFMSGQVATHKAYFHSLLIYVLFKNVNSHENENSRFLRFHIGGKPIEHRANRA